MQAERISFGPGGGALLAVKLARPAGELNEVLGECMDALVALPEPRAAVVYALASIRADGTLTARRRLADHDDDAVRHAARSFLSPE